MISYNSKDTLEKEDAKLESINSLLRIKPYDGDLSDKLNYFIKNNKIILQNPNSKDLKEFYFNYVADENSTQYEIYNQSSKLLLSYFFSGVNCTLFTYGISGAGKTFTLFGSDNSKGLFDITVTELFPILYKMQKNDKKNKLVCSVIEIYNEKIIDLTSNNKQELFIREINNVISLENLKEQEVQNSLEASNLLQQSLKNKHQNLNKLSSNNKSHIICSITLKQDNCNKSTFHFVDLAGSESYKFVNLNEFNLEINKENGHVNKSLLHLTHVLKQLVDNSMQKLSKNNLSYISYRDSKLTYLLKDSLGGNSKTLFIANINPDKRAYSETINTLSLTQNATLIKGVIRKSIESNQTISTSNSFNNKEANITNSVTLKSDFDDSYKELVISNAGLISENDYLKQTIERLNNSIKNIYSKDSNFNFLEIKSREIGVLKSRIEEKSKELSELEFRNYQLNEANNDLIKKLEVSQNEILKLKVVNSQQEEEISNLKNYHQKKENNFNEIKEQFNQLQMKETSIIEILSIQNDNLKLKYSDLEDKRNKEHEFVIKSKVLINDYEMERKMLNEKLKNYANSISSLLQDLEKTNEKNFLLKQNNDKLIFENNDLRNRYGFINLGLHNNKEKSKMSKDLVKENLEYYKKTKEEINNIKKENEELKNNNEILEKFIKQMRVANPLNVASSIQPNEKINKRRSVSEDYELLSKPDSSNILSNSQTNFGSKKFSKTVNSRTPSKIKLNLNNKTPTKLNPNSTLVNTITLPHNLIGQAFINNTNIKSVDLIKENELFKSENYQLRETISISINLLKDILEQEDMLFIQENCQFLNSLNLTDKLIYFVKKIQRLINHKQVKLDKVNDEVQLCDKNEYFKSKINQLNTKSNQDTSIEELHSEDISDISYSENKTLVSSKLKYSVKSGVGEKRSLNDNLSSFKLSEKPGVIGENIYEELSKSNITINNYYNFSGNQ